MIHWYKDGILQGALNNTITIDPGYTSKGEEWHFKVRPKDGVEFGAWASCSSNVTIGNTAPTASSLSISPTDPKTSNELSAVYIYADDDSDTESGTEFEWYKDGVLQIALTAVTVPASYTSRGDEWHFKVRSSDSIDYSQWISCPTNVTIVNTVSSVSNLAISPVYPQTGNNLNASYEYSDVDGDTESLSYLRWYKDGIEQVSYRNQTIVAAAATTKGDNWWFTVLPHDGTDYGLIKTSSVIQIENSVPTASNLDFFPSNPTRANNLTISYVYSDDDGDPESGTLIRWYRNNIPQTTFNDMVIIDSASIFKGDLWNVSIRVSDSTDISPNWVNVSITVANSPPIVVFLSPEIYNPGFLYTTSDLVASWDEFDPDGDSINDSKIVWFKNNGSIYEITSLENQTTVPASYTTKGDSWTFYMNIFDGEDWANPIGNIGTWQSASATISNSKPSVDNIVLSGGENTTDYINLTYTFYDADGDTEDTTVEWKIIHMGQLPRTVTQTSITMGTTSLSHTEFTAGDLIWVEINPSDGIISGDTVDSSTLAGTDAWRQVGDTPPQINTTQGKPRVLADHPNGSFIYTTIYSIYVNYSSFVEDVDRGESSSVYDFTEEQNVDILYTSVTKITGSQYRWYKFNYTSGKWKLQVDLTDSFVDPFYLHRDEEWKVSVRPRDNYGYYGDWQNSSSIIIGNSYPIIRAGSIIWQILKPTTMTDLEFNYEYYDWDGDEEDISKLRILWFKNGVLIIGTENDSILSHENFVWNDIITVSIQPYDGENWALTNFTSSAILIVNSLPEATNITLKPKIINYTDVLYLDWTYSDFDLNPENTSWRIVWTRNGALQLAFENMRIIPISNTNDGELWEATLQVYDGFNYSIAYYQDIIAKILSISYEFDPQTSQVNPYDLRKELQENPFIIDDEDLTISYQFPSTNDVATSRIQWFKVTSNDTFEEILFENMTTIPSMNTTVGDKWYCTITPFDGQSIWSKINSTLITIESRPVIETPIIDMVAVQTSTEGYFIFTVSISDLRNEITGVEFDLNDSLSDLPYYAKPGYGDEWIYEYQIPISEFMNYLNTIILGQVKVTTTVEYEGKEFQIYTITQFQFNVEDRAPPRAIDAFFVKNDEIHPSNVTFFAQIQEYGSGISKVFLLYYFEPVNESTQNLGGIASHLSQGTLEQDWLNAEMIYHNTTTINGDVIQIYSVTVPFDQNGTNWKVIYRVNTSDNAGNVNPLAFDILTRDPDRVERDIISFSPPGVDPTLVIIIVGFTILLALMGSIVYVKFIRKPELVGLDKELVLDKINDVTEAEVMAALDSHTIGVVISFFDQRHGPIPIIVEPEILRDNFTKLVELSDRSFSGTGFSDDFTVEISSSYDFVLAQGIRTKVMSFGYALERPAARGGQENLTANILIHFDLFPLVYQFLDEVQRKVHTLHLMMNEKASEKEKILGKVFELREFTSKIILAYEQLYGTTELISEEE
ncbi:MAG: hypothetical protein ACXAC8_03260 [Candidatus Hodarchaeales archaeon]